MMSRTLPERANLEFLTKQAKDLLRDVKAGDVIARERLRAWGPPGTSESPKLADCQHVLAREYGFASWPKLRAHVQALGATDPMEALAAALKTRRPAPVAEVLSRFPSVKARLDEAVPGGAFGATPLIVAVEQADRELVDLLLDRSPDPLKLAVACELGDERSFAALLQARPDLARTLDDDERRKLPFAAAHNNVEAVRLMLAAGWPVGAVGQHGGTALHWAGFHGNAAMARVILAHRPPLEARDKDFGQTPLGWTIYGSINGWHAERGDYAGVLELLLDAGATAPPLTPEVKASETVLAVLRRHASG
jgi:ankyrin repeat protein